MEINEKRETEPVLWMAYGRVVWKLHVRPRALLQRCTVVVVVVIDSLVHSGYKDGIAYVHVNF